jgi:hypothetical protein
MLIRLFLSTIDARQSSVIAGIGNVGCKTYLTPSKQIMKFYLMFLSINYRYCPTSVQAVA